MKVIDTKQSLSELEGGWAVTIGNFDGAHLGHRHIIELCDREGKARSASGLAVMTFDPHPAAILHPERAPGALTPIDYKMHLLAEAGVDCTIVLKDSYDLLNLSPQDFVDTFLCPAVGPKVVVEGADFNFGYGRSGTIRTLAELGKERRFDVIEAKSVFVDIEEGKVCCSSSITRRLLESGRAQEAAKVLGRNYRLFGTVTKGRGIGKELGFPTANLAPSDQIIPDEGVYAGRVMIGDKQKDLFGDDNTIPAVFSIGRAKTFITDYPILIEAHIFSDSIGDIYGKQMAMDFVQRLRHQERFADHDALKKQIAIDCRTAMNILKEQHGRTNGFSKSDRTD